MQIIDTKEKKYALISVLSFITMLFVLMLILGLRYPYPPPEEHGGVLIDFGDSETGFGQTEPAERQEITPPKQTSKPVQNEQNEETQNEPINTQDFDDEAPEVEKPSENKQLIEETKTHEVEEKPEPPKPVVEYGKVKSSAKQSNTQSEGISKYGGNQGVESGVPNAKNYSTSGSGNGYDWNLFGGKGRKIIAQPSKKKHHSNKNEKVVVEIRIDKYGNVKDAIPGKKGSTTTDSELLRLAKEHALEIKFSERLDVEEQKGSITVYFKVN